MRHRSTSSLPARSAGAAALLLAVLGVSAAAYAQTWLPIRSHNPFLQVFGLPAAEGADTCSPGETAFALSLDIGNHADADDLDGASAEIDGESYFLNLGFRRGLGSGVEIGLDLPLVAHSEGFLDGPIEKWHDFWGLSNSRREGLRNQLRFRYAAPDGDIFELVSPAGGIGDLRLSAALPLGQAAGGTAKFALRAAIKLPTGDADELLGSGAVDYSLSFHADRSLPMAGREMRLSALVGAVFPGDSDTLPVAQHDVVGIAGGAVAWQVTRRLALIGQLNAQSAIYGSRLDVIGGESVQLSVGGGYAFSRGTMSLTFGLVEDLFDNVTTDFTLHIGIVGYGGGG